MPRAAAATESRNRVDDAAEAIATRASSIGAQVGWFAGKAAVWTAVVLSMTVARHHTILRALGALERALTPDAAHVGVLATIVHTWATTYDAIWTGILGWLA